MIAYYRIQRENLCLYFELSVLKLLENTRDFLEKFAQKYGQTDSIRATCLINSVYGLWYLIRF